MDEKRHTLSRRGLLGLAVSAGSAAYWAARRKPGRVGAPSWAGAASASPGASRQIERLDQTGPQSGGTFTTYWPSNPPSMDPQADPVGATTSFACAAMSSLLRFQLTPDPQTGSNHVVVPELASRWETPDFINWIMHLNPNARFLGAPPVNGRAVESEDVKETFARGASAPWSPNREVVAAIDASQVDTPDAQTVQFRLPRPYTPLFQLLASVPDSLIFPREALSGSYNVAGLIIGSGPFYLASYTPDIGVVLRRNPQYFESGLPYIDTVRQVIAPGRDDQLAQFTAGNLDVLRVGPSDLAAATASNPSAQVIQGSGEDNYVIYFRLDGQSPYIDGRLRRAVSEAIDRDAIGTALYGGQYELGFAVSPIMGQQALSFDQLDSSAQQYYSFNPADATQLLQAAGYPNGLEAKLAYPAGAFGPEFDALAQMIFDMLSALGLNLTLVPLDYTDDYLGGGNGYAYGNFQADTMLLTRVHPFSTVDEYCYVPYYSKSAGNIEHIDDSRVSDPLDVMIDQARAVADPRLSAQPYLDIQKRLAEKMYAVGGLPVGYTYTLTQPWVQNYPYVPEAASIGRAWRTLWLTQ